MGPAFVWAATAQGSGELIWWPSLVARYGKAFLFLLLPAAIIQYFVNREISKYTAITGKGVWFGFLSIGKWYAIPLFFTCFLNFLWLGGYASAGGSSLFSVINFPKFASPKSGAIFWAYILIVVFSSGILLSKFVYNFIEKIMKIITIITLTGLAVSAFTIGTLPQLIDFLGSLVNPKYLGAGVDWTNFDYSQLITGIVFAGMGGFMNLMYSYWMREKGIGMAKYQTKITGLLVKTAKTNEADNSIFADNQENRTNFKKWLQYLNIDSGLAVGINALTIVLTSFLAFIILWPQKIYPAGWSLTLAQSAFFGAAFGPIGKILFLIVAAAFLVDTWLSLVDGVARQLADFSERIFQKLKKELKFWYYLWLLFLIIISMITLPLATPEFLLKTTGVISIFAFVFYIPALWYLNYIKLPKSYPKFIKEGPFNQLSLIFSWLVYLVLAVWYLSRIIIWR